MVTVLREAGFSFVIFRDDHPPAHVHVVGDGRAKIELSRDGAPTLVEARGFSNGDIRRIMRIVAEHQDSLVELWRSMHG